MKLILIHIYFLWAFLAPVTFATAQNEKNNPLVKAGGFINFIPGAPLYSLHFETEKTFCKVNALTSGPRVDYFNPKDLDKNIYIGYNFKWYPFFRIRQVPYHGLFIGIEPLYLIRIPDDATHRYGPGLGFPIGYQYLIKDKVALSLETNFIYIKNLNKLSVVGRGYYHPSELYFYFLMGFKVGIKLDKKERQLGE